MQGAGQGAESTGLIKKEGRGDGIAEVRRELRGKRTHGLDFTFCPTLCYVLCPTFSTPTLPAI
jgi:hypothetical protein